MQDSSLLTVVTFLPLATGVALLASAAAASLLGARDLPAPVWRLAGLGATAATFLLSLRLFSGFDPTDPGFQFVERAAWLPDWGIHYFVGIDGLSLFLVLLTTFLMPLVLLASWHDIDRSIKSYVFFMLFL